MQNLQAILSSEKDWERLRKTLSKDDLKLVLDA
jgi:hypothetical protein